MVTVYEVLKDYTYENNIEVSQSEKKQIGRMVSHHFKNYWSVSKGMGVIKGTGLFRTIEDAHVVVVTFYPDDFTGEIIGIIKTFLDQKAANKLQIIKSDRKLRKRIRMSKPT